jgi:hypothetical protein
MERKAGMELVVTDEQIVSRILGLPLERIEYLKTECEMPVSDPEFSDWFVANAALVLEEMKTYGPIARWKASIHEKPKP